MRYCPQCKESLSLDNFYGNATYCKPCVSIYKKNLAKGIKKTLPIIDRFRTKYVVNGNTGCWEWTASIANGYGAFHYPGGKKAHRFSYEYHTGKTLGDLTIDHLCNNTVCVNPDHLEAVTKGENSRRRNLNEYEYKRNEYCKKGHKREYLNKKTGQLDCVVCKREALAKYRQNNREKYNEYMRQYYLDNKDKK